MKRSRIILATIALLFGIATTFAFTQQDDVFLSYRIDPKKQEIKLYWQNKQGQNFASIQNLKTSLEKNKQTLLFAMNGGMYKPGGSPQGLYIQNKVMLSQLDTITASGKRDIEDVISRTGATLKLDAFKRLTEKVKEVIFNRITHCPTQTKPQTPAFMLICCLF
ncbi:hypothetical protein [Mucilaginibacter gilvus]|uniref:Uncharacterized protein n=1 Tax=Mucilaginibacter gilvus TaxID=2305909 RepID=A0A444MKF4_9SPHI|nr:hypothetical protein [Mucilaginibacter gilvus]RWY49348.1 hypothetical protein EPL05_18225 [Mucilaginibacter gilvus]